LIAEAGRGALGDRVLAALRLLDSEPKDVRCRRRSYGEQGWGMVVRTRDEDWLILWRTDPDGVPRVRYVGPDI
jgi:hypothetical protein